MLCDWFNRCKHFEDDSTCEMYICVVLVNEKCVSCIVMLMMGFALLILFVAIIEIHCAKSGLRLEYKQQSII